MKLYRIIVICIAIIFVFGCAGSSKKMNRLKLGMTKKEVIGAIGEPTSTSAQKNIEYLDYQLTTGGVFADAYYVRLLDGKVVAYGKVGDIFLRY